MNTVVNKKIILMGIFLLSIFFVLSLYWAILSSEHHDGFTKLVSISGQQRMLSQKLGYISQLPSFELAALNDLEIAIIKLEKNTLFVGAMLESKSNLDPELVNLGRKKESILHYIDIIEGTVYNTAITEPMDLYYHSQQILIYFEDIVELLEKASDKAEKSYLYAVISVFLSFFLIVLYVYQLFIAPRFKADRKALIDNADSLSLYKRLFEDSYDSILLFNNKWMLIAANKSSFEKIKQRNTSLPVACHYWLNSVFNDSKQNMTKQLNTIGAYKDHIDYITPENHHIHMAVNAMKIQANQTISDDNHYYAIMLKDITDLHTKQKETELIAQLDSLTGILNRSAILKKLNQACSDSLKNQGSVGLLFVDLDGFKKVNDVYGHAMGDKILIAIATQLSEVTCDTVTLARLGGDEFLFVCEGSSQKDSYATLAAIINGYFISPIVVQEQSFRLGASIGISIYPEHSNIPGELLRYADIAMYHSKNTHTNTYHFFNQNMLTILMEASLVETQLRQATSNNEFSQVYQPIFDLGESKVIGAELLLRWNNAELGSVSPVVFIPMAEKLELIYEIDKWSFYECLKSTAENNWHGYISINLSSLHFSIQNIIDDFLVKLKESGLKNEFIFEVTETALIEDIEQSSSVIKKIKRAGFSVAIDDFGTGYTSLYYLKVLPFDYIKIDRSFISDLCEDENSFSIVQAIIKLAKDLEIKVIAEGVETKNIEDALRKMGCDYVQGYLYDKPIPFASLNEKYSHRITL